MEGALHGAHQEARTDPAMVGDKLIYFAGIDKVRFRQPQEGNAS